MSKLRQKFPRFSYVKVDDTLPVGMAHFECGFEAIVKGTYQQLHSGDNITEYCLYLVEGGKVVNTVAWYDECQLTPISRKSRLEALELVDDYLSIYEDEDYMDEGLDECRLPP